MPSASRPARARWTVVWGLAQDACQLRGVDERRPAEGVEQLSVGDRHVLSVAALHYDRAALCGES